MPRLRDLKLFSQGTHFVAMGMALLALGTLVACSSGNVKPGDADQTFAPAPKELSSFRVNDPEPPQVIDKELDTVPPEMQPKVEQWIAYFQGKGRPHMERYLSRSTRYIQLMKRIMRQNGLPEDLVYIALIESGFSSRATSRAAAVGYWQFIKGTGRRYGLEINSFVDERRDPVLSTQAAAEYFKGLYSIFGSWYLAMASYNVGENRVKREVMSHFTRDFWELARKRRFPKETVNYIPKFIAARWIAKDPERYGFNDIEFEKPQEFELIRVNKPVNLKAMAQKMNIEYEDLKIINPKFRGEVAPVSQNELELRVPVGQVEAAMSAAQSSVADRVEFVADAGETDTYRVRSGDSLYTIARKYHTTVAFLRDVNDLKAGKKLRIGMRLQVPDRSSGSKETHRKQLVQSVKAAPKEHSADDTETAMSNPEQTTKRGTFYVVQPGDTLSAIADEYDSSIAEIRRMNRLGKGSMIRAGMKLKVPKEDEGLPSALEDLPIAGKPAAPSAENVAAATSFTAPTGATSETQGVATEVLSHKVKAGENLTVIAKQYGVTVRQIRDANNLKHKSKITAGMTLMIPVRSKPSSSVDSRGKRLPAGRLKEIANLQRQKNLQRPRYPVTGHVKYHVVKKGENLTHIASHYQVSLNALKQKNQLDGDSRLLVGSKLVIPIAEAKLSRFE
jgi:membrane-bound lytic murein transglycosylase D